MTPQEIMKCLAEERRRLHAEPVETKEGFSFWLGPRGNKNRILRASRTPSSSVTKMKLAVTHRLPDLRSQTKVEFSFSGDRAELLRYVDREVELYESRIEPKAKGGAASQS